jgi:hypothetical protein
MTDNTVNTPAKKAPGLLRSSVLVGSMTMTSRVLGLLRDVVVAAFVGATANADAFFVAFKIPNFLRRLFAEGAFSQAFIPVLADYKADGSRVAVKALIDRVSGVLGGSLLLITAISMLAAPVITMIFAPGFVSQPEKFELTAAMIRITFPYLLLISMTGFCGAILNSYGRFAVPAFTPVFLNLSLIFAALVAAPWFEVPVFALAWGVLFAGVIQLLFQLPSLYRLELVPRPRWDTKDEGVRRILKLMVPALFGVSVGQINLLLDTVLASFLPTGSVSWLYYSDRLAELPLGIFGIAIATVILPNLSLHRAAAPRYTFQRHAGLGGALGVVDWRAVGIGTGVVGPADTDHAVPVRQADLERREYVRPEPAGVQSRPGRIHAGESAGAGILRAQGHGHPGKNRYHRDGREYVYERLAGSTVDVPVERRACGACARDQPCRDPQRRVCCCGDCCATAFISSSRAGCRISGVCYSPVPAWLQRSCGWCLSMEHGWGGIGSAGSGSCCCCVRSVLSFTLPLSVCWVPGCHIFALRQRFRGAEADSLVVTRPNHSAIL